MASFAGELPNPMKILPLRFEQRLRYEAFRLLRQVKSFHTDESLIITSEPRSGSTWLMEIMAAQDGVIANWEPLHVSRGAVPAQMNLGWRPGPPSTEDASELLKLFADILTLKQSSVWTTRYVELRKVRGARHVLTKFVRANRLLSWLVEHFQFKYKPVYLVRHPVAVAQSQLKHFGNAHMHWKSTSPAEISIDEIVLNQFMESLKSDLERQVAQWCVLNASLLKASRDGCRDWVLVFYEDLIRHPEDSIVSLGDAIGFAMDPSKAKFGRASRSDFSGSYLTESVEQQINKHLTRLKQPEIIRVQQILDFFGIEEYNASEGLPLMKN